VFVESRTAALREAGDLTPGLTRTPGNLAELVTGRLRIAEDRPRLSKSVGMVWEDLIIAVAAYERVGTE
jgi:ornithine cyclodeaminase/alanine dehydrogenase-like protein (mu-crystallin family)